MSTTLTLAEQLSGRNYSTLFHPCAICRKPVFLTTNTLTTESGRAVHEACLRKEHYEGLVAAAALD